MGASSRNPLYLAIAENLRTELKRGVYTAAKALPPMAVLAERFEVSRTTVREAIEMLEREGLVETRQGVGTRLTARALRRSDEPVDVEENFTSWKKLVNLPPEFPVLTSLNWADLEEDEKQKLYLRPLQEKVEKQIITTASGYARPQVSVIVNRGHGCTTLLNHVYKHLEGHMVIPVRVTWQRLGDDPDDFSEKLEEIIREDVLRELTKAHWQHQAREVPYARLLGAIGNSESTPDLDDHRKRIYEALPEGDTPVAPGPPAEVSPVLHGLAPMVTRGPLPTLLQELRAAMLKTLLMIDLSAGDWPLEGDPPLGDLVGVVKDLLERLPAPDDGTLLSEMYFCTAKDHAQMTGLFSRAHHKIAFPPYTQADIFGILTRHYPAFVEIAASRDKVLNYSKNDLAAVVPSRLLGEAEADLSRSSMGFADIGLEEIVALLRVKILEALDRPWSQVTYHLDSWSAP